MCYGIPIFANNRRALHGTGTTSHSTSAEQLEIDEDKFRKYEYHWWEKKLVADEYDDTAEDILQKIDPKKAMSLARALVKKKFSTQRGLALWLKKTPNEWGRLMDPKFKRLAKAVNPKLLIYQDKIAKFKKINIEKYNPYQATKLPPISALKKHPLGKVGNQVGDQVWNQVGDQVWNQVGAQVGNQVGDQVWNQVGAQVGAQVWDQVRAQVRDQVWDQVWNQVRAQVWDQVRATSYWGVKIALDLPVKHWFFDFLKLGVMIVFVSGKAKVFGKKGKYLGEYDEKDLF